jgi:hypothetical protein
MGARAWSTDAHCSLSAKIFCKNGVSFLVFRRPQRFDVMQWSRKSKVVGGGEREEEGGGRGGKICSILSDYMALAKVSFAAAVVIMPREGQRTFR